MLLSELLSQKKPLLLDGAMGTELQRRGVDSSLPLWSARALMAAPHIVRNIHSEYLHAGADIITTNTFRTNIRTLKRAGIFNRLEELNLRAVQLAFEARDRYKDSSSVLIAGSIAPVEDCYSPHLVPSENELEDEHGKQIEFLSQTGIDFILIETMNTIREATIASKAASKSGKEFAISFVCTNEGDILSGESLLDAVRKISLFNPTMFLVNCISAASILNAFRKLRSATNIPVGLYANVGTPSSGEGWKFSYDVSIDSYIEHAKEWINEGASLIGGCCGTTPEYISRMRMMLESESEKWGVGETATEKYER